MPLPLLASAPSFSLLLLGVDVTAGAEALRRYRALEERAERMAAEDVAALGNLIERVSRT